MQSKSEIRNPKFERNPKREIRNPNGNKSLQGFGLRNSGFFRSSDFGLRVWPLVVLALLALGLTVTPAFAAPANTVPQWGIYEIELKGPTNGNPFLDVSLSAVFNNGLKSVEAAGFYDGDGIYRIRFMPDTQGRWQYETKANRWELTNKTGEFTVAPPGKAAIISPAER